jgi:hypothetical protein
MAVHKLLSVFVILCCLCFESLCRDSPHVLQRVPAAAQTLDVNPSSEHLTKNASVDDWLFGKQPAAPKFVRNGVIDYSLQKRASKLHKRAGSDPLIKFPQCLRCADKSRTDGQITMADLTSAKLLGWMLPYSQIEHCLFYGQRVKGLTPPSLSRSAQQYTCMNLLSDRCIWVSFLLSYLPAS